MKIVRWRSLSIAERTAWAEMKRRQFHELLESKRRSLARRGAELTRLYETGKTMQEIADSLGLTRERVRQIMNAFEHKDRFHKKHRAKKFRGRRPPKGSS